MEWSTTTFEYVEDGIRVSVPDVPAWVCPVGGEVSFTPEVTDQLIVTVRELAAAARRAREHKPLMPRYVVQMA